MTELITDIGIISLLSLLSGLVTSILGFGAGLVLTPLLTFFMPLKEALGIGALVFFFTSLSKTYWYFPEIHWETWKKCLPLSLVGIGLGMLVIQFAPERLLELTFASILMFFAVHSMLGKDDAQPLLPKSIYPLFAGIASILVHASGVFYFRYCRMSNMDRVRTVATISVLHFTLNIFKAIFFTSSGLVDPKYIYYLTPAYAAAVLGTRLGKTVLKNHVSEKMFTIGVSVIMMLLAIKLFSAAI